MEVDEPFRITIKITQSQTFGLTQCDCVYVKIANEVIGTLLMLEEMFERGDNEEDWRLPLTFY